jgi:hypothetical protein
MTGEVANRVGVLRAAKSDRVLDGYKARLSRHVRCIARLEQVGLAHELAEQAEPVAVAMREPGDLVGPAGRIAREDEAAVRRRLATFRRPGEDRRPEEDRGALRGGGG